MRFKTPVALDTICQLLSLEKPENSTSHSVLGINEIHKVEPGDLTFVDHPKYYKKALNSASTFVLINSLDVANENNKVLLFTEDPFSDYNKLVLHYSPLEKPPSEKTQFDSSNLIFPNVFLGENVTLGKNCRIHSNVSIYANSVIGDNVIIHANTVIGGDAFYFQKRENGYNKMANCGRVVIENDVEIGAACTIDKGVSGDTIIGRGTKLDNQVHIGHGVVLGEQCLFAAQVGVAGKTIIGNNVIAWGQVGISKDLQIGDNVVILAQSGVKDNLPANGVYFGSPAKPARDKMREIAALKQLPEMYRQFKND